jgi:hypothetical protein
LNIILIKYNFCINRLQDNPVSKIDDTRKPAKKMPIGHKSNNLNKIVPVASNNSIGKRLLKNPSSSVDVPTDQDSDSDIEILTPFKKRLRDNPNIDGNKRNENLKIWTCWCSGENILRRKICTFCGERRVMPQTIDDDSDIKNDDNDKRSSSDFTHKNQNIDNNGNSNDEISSCNNAQNIDDLMNDWITDNDADENTNKDSASRHTKKNIKSTSSDINNSIIRSKKKNDSNYECFICVKIYKCYHTLWSHNKNYHDGVGDSNLSSSSHKTDRNTDNNYYNSMEANNKNVQKKSKSIEVKTNKNYLDGVSDSNLRSTSHKTDRNADRLFYRWAVLLYL